MTFLSKEELVQYRKITLHDPVFMKELNDDLAEIHRDHLEKERQLRPTRKLMNTVIDL